jgi:hypothetical protein
MYCFKYVNIASVCFVAFLCLHLYNDVADVKLKFVIVYNRNENHRWTIDYRVDVSSESSDSRELSFIPTFWVNPICERSSFSIRKIFPSTTLCHVSWTRLREGFRNAKFLYFWIIFSPWVYKSKHAKRQVSLYKKNILKITGLLASPCLISLTKIEQKGFRNLKFVYFWLCFSQKCVSDISIDWFLHRKNISTLTGSLIAQDKQIFLSSLY